MMQVKRDILTLRCEHVLVHVYKLVRNSTGQQFQLWGSLKRHVLFAHGAVTPGDGEVIPMDIELHDKSMITYPGTPDPPQKCFKKSINFHDFTKGLVAMKITKKNTCFVKPSDETYDDIKKVVDNIKKGETAPKVQATEEWVVPKTPLPAEEIEQKVGERIAKFCSGCKVHLLQDGKVIRAAADVPRVTAKRGAVRSRSKRWGGWCLFCWGCKTSGK
ncbi:uncharacterized protein LOC124260255 isoform X2 [Haliotis rubra]|uniref:uncharacterized protein LOC124260255 isoform X2 n=1 Tax=Haliotis rubra TaxID=36100 RepID=UPI001EE533E6|nr:uncharacterized protein LOC124260255 isoform X2 [Haliotis rubra]